MKLGLRTARSRSTRTPGRRQSLARRERKPASVLQLRMRHRAWLQKHMERKTEESPVLDHRERNGGVVDRLLPMTTTVNNERLTT